MHTFISLKKSFFLIITTLLMVGIIYEQASASRLQLTLSGASNEIVQSGEQLRSGLHYFLPGDLFQLKVKNDGNIDGNVFVSMHMRSDSNSSIAHREWLERWFIYSSIFPFSSPTISSNYTPQALTTLPSGQEITLLNFFIDGNIRLRYPLIFTAYMFDDANNVIGFDSVTAFFRPF